MKARKVAAIGKNAKIVDVKHVPKLDALKKKWDKKRPLKVLDLTSRKEANPVLLHSKVIARIEKAKRLDELQKSVEALKKIKGDNPAPMHTYEELKRAGRMKRKANRFK